MRRVSRPHPYIAISFIAATAMMAACQAGEAPAPNRLAGADIALAADTIVVRNVVPRNTTLDTLLRDHGVEAETVGRVVAAMAGVFDPRQLRSLQPFLIERSTLGALRLFEYEIDADRILRVSTTVDTPALAAEVVPIPKRLVESTAAGVIDRESSSLFAAMKTAGETRRKRSASISYSNSRSTPRDDRSIRNGCSERS